jgi:hypothetical protein
LLWLFWRWRSLYLPGLASNLPISTSQVARITGVSYECPLPALLYWVTRDSVLYCSV